MVTGTNAYQELFQGLLAEGTFADGKDYLLPVVKLSGDSVALVTQINDLVPFAYDTINLIYTGTLVSEVIYKNLGIQVVRLLLSYNSDDNVTSVVRT